MDSRVPYRFDESSRLSGALLTVFLATLVIPVLVLLPPGGRVIVGALWVAAVLGVRYARIDGRPLLGFLVDWMGFRLRARRFAYRNGRFPLAVSVVIGESKGSSLMVPRQVLLLSTAAALALAGGYLLRLSVPGKPIVVAATAPVAAISGPPVPVSAPVVVPTVSPTVSSSPCQGQGRTALLDRYGLVHFSSGCSLAVDAGGEIGPGEWWVWLSPVLVQRMPVGVSAFCPFEVSFWARPVYEAVPVSRNWGILVCRSDVRIGVRASRPGRVEWDRGVAEMVIPERWMLFRADGLMEQCGVVRVVLEVPGVVEAAAFVR